MEDKRIKLDRDEIYRRNMSKFANDEHTGVNKLTATGCMERYNITRDEQYMSKRENVIRNWETGNIEEYKEQQMQIATIELLNKGARLRPNDSLEEFIIYNQHLLGEEWVEFILELEGAI
jgi:hypothetical protein